MSWREELRKLDEELAAGQISADDYRTRRDQVLSSAVSSPGQDSQPSPGEATHMIPPAEAPGQRAPDGPPPDAAGGHRGEEDKTQVVSGHGGDSDKTQIVPGPAGGDAERTQAVGGWHTARPRGDDSESTQIVPGVPPQQFVGGQAPRPAPGVGAPPPGWEQQGDPGPAWSGSEFPPLAATGTPDWIRQGPEVFEESGRGNAGKFVAILLAVIVLGGLVFGAFWLWGRDDNKAGGPGGSSTTAPASTTKTSRTSKPPAPDPLPVAVLPGKEERHSDVKAFSDVPKLNYLNEAELQAYEGAGAAEAKFNVRHLDTGSHVVFLLVKAAGADTAKTAAAALRDIQITNGALAAASPPVGVLVTEIDAKDGQPAQIRAHYMHGNTLVRVEVWNPNGLAAARADFPTVIDAQLKVLSADA